MSYHTAAVGRSLDSAGGDECVVVSRLVVSEDPRVAPHPFGLHGTLAPLLVVSRVGLDERVLRVLAPADQILRRSRSGTLYKGVTFDAYPCVEHVPSPLGPNHAPGPDGAIVPGPRRADAQRVRQDMPVPEVLRSGVADRGVQVPQFRVAQSAGRLKVEGVVVHAVAHQPEIPYPLIGKP